MGFNENKPIYLQIFDRICADILAEKYKTDDRMPSVREMASFLEVNPNTVMRAYEKASSEELIYNQRGIGYFLAEGAHEKVLENARQEFLKKELPRIKKRIALLGIDPEIFKSK